MIKQETYSNRIAEFLLFCRDITDIYKNACNQVALLDGATQDLLHQIELGSYEDRDKAATKLSKVRKSRRYYKDIANNYEPFVEFISNKDRKYDVPHMLNLLSEVLGETRKREKCKENRIYTPKVIKNLDFIEYPRTDS